jgi:hypothetical protein
MFIEVPYLKFYFVTLSLIYFSTLFGQDFSDIDADLTAVSHSSLAWGDFDNDGDLDILLSGFIPGSYKTDIYRNDNEQFININAGITGVVNSSLAWGDYDNDGDLDILISGVAVPGIYMANIYRNDSGVFTDINAGMIGVEHSSTDWGDYDNDGDLDVLLSGISGSGNIIARI